MKIPPGIGVLAVDRFVDLGGILAGMSPETMQKLGSALPPIGRAPPFPAESPRLSWALLIGTDKTIH